MEEDRPLFNKNETMLFTEITENVSPAVQKELRRAAAATDTPSQMLIMLARQSAVEAFELLVKHGMRHIDGDDILAIINNIECGKELNGVAGQLKLMKRNEVTLVFPDDDSVKTATRQLLNKIFYYSSGAKIHHAIASRIYINEDFIPSAAQSNNFKYAKILAVSRLHACLFDKTTTAPVQIRRWLARRGVQV